MPTTENLSFMGITSTKSCGLYMEYNRKENDAETWRQKLSNLLHKNVNLKIRSNITKDERRTLKRLQRDDKFRKYKFDKGCSLAIVTGDTTKEKTKRLTR